MVDAHIRADADAVYERRKKGLSVTSTQTELLRLTSFRGALDGYAELLRQSVAKDPNYMVDPILWGTIKTTLEKVITQLGGSSTELSFNEQPITVHSQN